MTPVRPSWNLFSSEFHCPGCTSQEAYRSRPRGFFERRLLPLLHLQPVRCDHCHLRIYVSLSIPAPERMPVQRMPAQCETTVKSDTVPPSNQSSSVA